MYNTEKTVSEKKQLKRQSTPHKHHQTIDSEEKVNICLTCKRPASECKGNCWGNY